MDLWHKRRATKLFDSLLWGDPFVRNRVRSFRRTSCGLQTSAQICSVERSVCEIGAVPSRKFLCRQLHKPRGVNGRFI
jgi:hypothetical protein